MIIGWLRFCCFISGFAMEHGCVISELKGQAIGVVLQSCDFSRTV